MKNLIVVSQADDGCFQLIYSHGVSNDIPGNETLHSIDAIVVSAAMDEAGNNRVIHALYTYQNETEIFYTRKANGGLDKMYFQMKRYASPGVYRRFYEGLESHLANSKKSSGKTIKLPPRSLLLPISVAKQLSKSR